MSPDELLTFFKSLADANRLRLIGLLAHRPHSVDELATVLDLRASTVSHHLKRLSEAELVRAVVDGHYHVYSLDLDRLQERARALGQPDTLRAVSPPASDLDPYDARVLRAFLDDDGRLVQVPMKRKKFEVVLRHALRRFDDDGPWDERELNSRLESLSRDTATLRRGFIDHGYMVRDKRGERYEMTARGREA